MDAAPADFVERIKLHAHELGFGLVGVARMQPSEHAAFYRAWLASGRHGEMSYLAREDAVSRRCDPAAAWPQLRSAVVVGMEYGRGEGEDEDEDEGEGEGEGEREGEDEDGKGSRRAGGRNRVRGVGEMDGGRAIIARYAAGRDYHKILKKKLLALLAHIERQVGRELPAARAYVDTGPVLERELARRAGLGWFGRNTMLVNPRRGSYFFIGTLLLELDLTPDAPFTADRCGTCNACVEACPTGALLGRDEAGAPVIDATRCISYLTIEQRGAIPQELRPLIGNRIFGCDVCQEVCPWNSPKFAALEAKRIGGAKP